MPLTFDSVSCADAVQAYEENGVIVYERVATSHYSARILLSLGLEGVVRVSPLHCHTLEEAERFLQVTGKTRGSAPGLFVRREVPARTP